MTRRAKLKRPSQVLELYSQQLIKGLTSRLSPSEFELNYSFRSPKVAYISGFAVFRNGALLEFDEVIKQENNQVSRLKYRYHVMDSGKSLLFRYDNVAHHPEIKSHPHHKHLLNKVVESSTPSLVDVVNEITTLVIKSY